jgi:hypothetical protein
MGEPRGRIPVGYPFEETPEIFQAQQLDAARRFENPEPIRIEVVDEVEPDRTNRGVEVDRLTEGKRLPTEDHPAGFALAVDRLDGRIKSFEVMNTVDKRPLPAAVEVEMVDRRIAEIERDPAGLDADENVLAIAPLEADPSRIHRARLEKTGSFGCLGHRNRSDLKGRWGKPADRSHQFYRD